MGILSGRTPLGEGRQGLLQAGIGKWDSSRWRSFQVRIGRTSSWWAPSGRTLPDHREYSSQHPDLTKLAPA